MIDEKIEAILNEEIDGVATPEDRARLREILESNPEARAYSDDLRAVVHSLDQARLEEPPTSIKANVLRMIEAREAERLAAASPRHAPSGVRGWVHEALGALSRRPAWGGGLVFASGLAVGLVVFTLLGRSPVLDTADLTGTMVPVQERFERIDMRSIGLEGVEGRVETGISPEGRALHLDLRSSREVEVTVGFAGKPQTFRGFYQLEPEAGLVSFDPGGLRILHRGQNRYLLTLSGDGDAPAEIVVQIRAGGEVFEERLAAVRR